MWHELVIESCKVQAKVYDEPSAMGIEGGRVSKLWVQHNGATILNYDRGWDVRPTTPLAKRVLVQVLAEYPNP